MNINKFCIECFGLRTPVGLEPSPIDFTFSPCMVIIYVIVIGLGIYLISKKEKREKKNDM